MSSGVHSVVEQRAIIARLNEMLAPTFHDGVPDEHLNDFDGDLGTLEPYGIVTFGTPIRAARDRSILGARHQPYIQPFVVDCWGGSADDVRNVASGVIDVLLGWMPDGENATEIECSGGGDYRSRDTQGRPSRFAKRVEGEYLVNMHTPPA